MISGAGWKRCFHIRDEYVCSKLYCEQDAVQLHPQLNVFEDMMILATLCYVKRDGYTLMVYRNRKQNDIHEGKWNGLGGKFEAGETPEECVVREVYEESGLSIHNPKLCGLLMFPNFMGNDWYVFVFTATDFKGELIESPEGKLEWIPDEKLLGLNLWESDHIFMPWIQEGKFFSAKFEYEEEKMRRYDVVFHR